MAFILRTAREIAHFRADDRLNMAPLRKASREAQYLALTAPQCRPRIDVNNRHCARIGNWKRETKLEKTGKRDRAQAESPPPGVFLLATASALTSVSISTTFVLPLNISRHIGAIR
jgi:hypothetical protein